MEIKQGNKSDTINGDRVELLRFRRLCKSARKRIIKKLKKQKNEFEIAGKWLLNRQIGDSLLAEAARIPKGVSEWDIHNVHTQVQEKVKLNPKLSAARNAEIYYRKAKKGKRGVEICREQLHGTEDELAEIEKLLQKCDACLLLSEKSDEFMETFHEIQLAVEKNRIITGLSSYKDAKKDIARVPYRHFTIDKYDIYIGKNNAQNDELTITFAKPSDIWFHVVAHAGSHVVLRRNKNSDWPPKSVVEKVAALAVWFSKARYTSYAEVHVAEARFVYKPRKAPPGEVVVKHYKTVRVAPKSPQELFKE